MKLKKYIIENKKIIGWLLFSSVFLIAVILRFYKISSLPVGVSPDEAYYGNQALNFLQNTSLKNYYSAILAGGVFEKFIILSIKIFGNTIFALRVVPSLFGLAAIIMTFVLSKKWFNTRTALIISFFMAISPWMIVISRSVSPASMMPFLVSLTLYLSTLLVIKKRIIYGILLGLTVAVGLCTYFTFYVIIPVLLIGFTIFFAKNKKWLNQASRCLIAGISTFIIAIVPLFFIFLRHPSVYTNKIFNMTFFANGAYHDKLLSKLGDGLAKAILAFNFRGDENYFYNLAGLPLLNTFMGIMFVLGIMIAIVRIKRTKYAVIISLFVFSLIPLILSFETSSLSLALSISAVSVFVLMGIGVNYLLAKWYSIFPINNLARNIGLSLVLVLMFLSMWQSYKQYFVAWAQDPKSYIASFEAPVGIAKYLNSLENNDIKDNSIYLILDNRGASVVDYLASNKRDYFLVDLDQVKALPIDSTKKIIILAIGGNNAEADSLIKSKFTNAKIKEQLSLYTDKDLFYIYSVNR